MAKAGRALGALVPGIYCGVTGAIGLLWAGSKGTPRTVLWMAPLKMSGLCGSNPVRGLPLPPAIPGGRRGGARPDRGGSAPRCSGDPNAAPLMVCFAYKLNSEMPPRPDRDGCRSGRCDGPGDLLCLALKSHVATFWSCFPRLPYSPHLQISRLARERRVPLSRERHAYGHPRT